jgi:hypothetical protein
MKLFCILILITFSLSSRGQDMKGIWVGYLDTDVRNITALEVNYVLHIKDQNKKALQNK